MILSKCSYTKKSAIGGECILRATMGREGRGGGMRNFILAVLCLLLCRREINRYVLNFSESCAKFT